MSEEKKCTCLASIRPRSLCICNLDNEDVVTGDYEVRNFNGE